jgi:hypothetical protein
MIWKPWNYILIGYEVFSMVWFSLWISYSCSYAIMFSASSYYFNSDQYGVGQAEVGLALKMTHINNMGTVAFASVAMAPI